MPLIVGYMLSAILLILITTFTPPLWAAPSPPDREPVMGIVARMEAAYAQVEAYRAKTEVSEYREGRLVAKKRFLYTFKKPNHVRIDMEFPYPGMILVYPDEDEKVAVKPGGWAGFLKLHLSLDSALLRSSAGQHIDQTDVGLLIRSMAHSLTDRRRGEIWAGEEGGQMVIQVLSEDHFLAGVVTLYRFYIDMSRWLPAGVEEFTPDGVPKRKVTFRDLRILGNVSDRIFRIDGEDSNDGQSGR